MISDSNTICVKLQITIEPYENRFFNDSQKIITRDKLMIQSFVFDISFTVEITSTIS